ncbi:ImmA/IrrE family metallo-endopeptidase [Marinobacter sp. NP-6]|uniref:ImmA/IrrE family metallo-endopeptidase n=1 Tax=Marinobacter sp. NP-6 TaxID=2488666 RepID=UPI000FCBAE75|nr:ImmA/IrrE family metallo-endopeptidase [Marinobacter sp. NP-6]RUT76995.1 ImmA/IrrE family metallo-endopeptidase [Marinobacter sp. NP-6]
MAFVRKAVKENRVPPEFEDLSTPEDVVKLAKQKGISTSPLNVSELSLELGIIVRFQPMHEDDSGTLFKEKKTGQWVMIVNSLHHPHRQRFTIAHEIAHRIRHAANQDEFNDKAFFRNGNSNWMETEANNFAATILMPKEDFIRAVDSGKTRIEEIAAHFQVSSMAVRIRAKALGFDGHGL